MGEVQVLVATMHRQDCSLAQTMNIRCSAVIANQGDREEIRNEDTPWGPIKMITTPTRGVGLNRNIALLAAQGDILLFADDDVVYRDDMPQAVAKAFRDRPDADVMIFSMDLIRNGAVSEKRHLKDQRRHLWNSLRFGTYTIAIRREAAIGANLSFHQSFGGGCRYGSGEDSLFIRQCFDRKLRVYSSSYVLGTCCKDTSSWFTGYGEKYFYDKGVLLRHLFPRAYYWMVPYFVLRFWRRSEISTPQRLKWILAGIRWGKYRKSYEQYHEENSHCK